MDTVNRPKLVAVAAILGLWVMIVLTVWGLNKL